MKPQTLYKNGNELTITYEDDTFKMYYLFGVVTVTPDEMLKILVSVGDKIMELDRNRPLEVGDHVKILGNAVDTAWETGCIESIEGCMAHIVYGVKTLGEFGGIRGMGIPVPLSMLKRMD